jgi:hypothetical protein
MPVSGTGQVGGIPAPLAIACNRGVPGQLAGRIFPSGENAPNNGGGNLTGVWACRHSLDDRDQGLTLGLAILGMSCQLPDAEKLGPAPCCLAW